MSLTEHTHMGVNLHIGDKTETRIERLVGPHIDPRSNIFVMRVGEYRTNVSIFLDLAQMRELHARLGRVLADEDETEPLADAPEYTYVRVPDDAT